MFVSFGTSFFGYYCAGFSICDSFRSDTTKKQAHMRIAVVPAVSVHSSAVAVASEILPFSSVPLTILRRKTSHACSLCNTFSGNLNLCLHIFFLLLICIGFKNLYSNRNASMGVSLEIFFSSCFASSLPSALTRVQKPPNNCTGGFLNTVFLIFCFGIV